MIDMSQDQTNISPMRLTAAIAEKRIRETAALTKNVIFGTHVRQRMVEREIFDVDVLRILRSGHVDEWPELTEFNEWKCKVTLKIRGGRTAGVVTIFRYAG